MKGYSQQSLREELQTSLLVFSMYMFEANKGSRWQYNAHQKKICNALSKVLVGKTKRLIITIPPRFGKTELAVINFISWSMGIFPDSEFIHVSYSKRLASNNAYQCRALMMSEPYRAVFPHIALKQDSKARDEFRTVQGGVVYATGSSGTITGYGAGKIRNEFGGAIIIDDIAKASSAKSDIERQNVIDWYQSTLESRCNSVNTPIIVIGQRLHENDLPGWLLAGNTGEPWEHLNLPVLNDNDESLWPAKFSVERLKQMEEADPYTFAGQYMQNPVPRSGGLFKHHWVQRYSEPPESRQILRLIQSWDTAYKADAINDPSACTTWAETEKGFYLLNCFCQRMEYPDLKYKIKAMAYADNPNVILIEDKASGQSLIQELRRETRLPVIAINPEGDKVTRANAVTALFESGRVFLPESAPWLKEYEAELFTFPMTVHDDQVDATTQALKYAHDTSARSAITFRGNRASSTIKGKMLGV